MIGLIQTPLLRPPVRLLLIGRRGSRCSRGTWARSAEAVAAPGPATSERAGGRRLHEGGLRVAGGHERPQRLPFSLTLLMLGHHLMQGLGEEARWMDRLVDGAVSVLDDLGQGEPPAPFYLDQLGHGTTGGSHNVGAEGHLLPVHSAQQQDLLLCGLLPHIVEQAEGGILEHRQGVGCLGCGPRGGIRSPHELGDGLVLGPPEHRLFVAGDILPQEVLGNVSVHDRHGPETGFLCPRGVELDQERADGFRLARCVP